MVDDWACKSSKYVKHIHKFLKASKIFASLGKFLKYLELLESAIIFASLGKCKHICKWSKRVWQGASGRGRRSTFEPSTGFRAHTSLLPLLALLATSLLAALATRWSPHYHFARAARCNVCDVAIGQGVTVDRSHMGRGGGGDIRWCSVPLLWGMSYNQFEVGPSFWTFASETLVFCSRTFGKSNHFFCFFEHFLYLLMEACIIR